MIECSAISSLVSVTRVLLSFLQAVLDQEFKCLPTLTVSWVLARVTHCTGCILLHNSFFQ